MLFSILYCSLFALKIIILSSSSITVKWVKGGLLWLRNLVWTDTCAGSLLMAYTSQIHSDKHKSLLPSRCSQKLLFIHSINIYWTHATLCISAVVKKPHKVHILMRRNRNHNPVRFSLVQLLSRVRLFATP